MDDMTAYYTPQTAPQPPPQQQPDIHYSHYPLPPPRFTYPETPLPPPLPPHHPPPRGDDEVRTLFIAGLPEDVKDREMFHLFREFPGFVSSNLRTHSNKSQAFAFAVFADQQSAVAAMHELNGMVFDLEKGSTLFIDLAKSNSRSKRQRIDDERTGSAKKHKNLLVFPRGSVESGKTVLDTRKLHESTLVYKLTLHNFAFHTWALAGLGSLHIPGMDNSHHDMVGYPSAQSHLNFKSRGIFDASVAQSNTSISSTIPQDKSPCPTIFVANLGPKCSEQELQQIFSRSRGFLKLKFQRAYGAPVAFVDFKDTACSTEALIHLQRTILHSSPAGEGMRLEYAKSRMGMQRRNK